MKCPRGLWLGLQGLDFRFSVTGTLKVGSFRNLHATGIGRQGNPVPATSILGLDKLSHESTPPEKGLRMYCLGPKVGVGHSCIATNLTCETMWKADLIEGPRCS